MPDSRPINKQRASHFQTVSSYQQLIIFTPKPQAYRRPICKAVRHLPKLYAQAQAHVPADELKAFRRTFSWRAAP